MPFFIMFPTLLLVIFSYPTADLFFGQQFAKLPLIVFGILMWAWLSSVFIWLLLSDQKDKENLRNRQASADGSDFNFDSDGGGSDGGGDGGGD